MFMARTSSAIVIASFVMLLTLAIVFIPAVALLMPSCVCPSTFVEFSCQFKCNVSLLVGPFNEHSNVAFVCGWHHTVSPSPVLTLSLSCNATLSEREGPRKMVCACSYIFILP